MRVGGRAYDADEGPCDAKQGGGEHVFRDGRTVRETQSNCRDGACTVGFIWGLDDRWACFVIREHANYPWASAGPEECVGETTTGTVDEQPMTVIDDAGRAHAFRRIRGALKMATRDGDLELALNSNLPQTTATATEIADSYHTRWTIETAFQDLTEHLQSEINTLGYPPAALFGFCGALVAYMLLQVSRAALRQAHGAKTVNQVVSG